MQVLQGRGGGVPEAYPKLGLPRQIDVCPSDGCSVVLLDGIQLVAAARLVHQPGVFAAEHLQGRAAYVSTPPHVPILLPEHAPSRSQQMYRQAEFAGLKQIFVAVLLRHDYRGGHAEGRSVPSVSC